MKKRYHIQMHQFGTISELEGELSMELKSLQDDGNEILKIDISIGYQGTLIGTIHYSYSEPEYLMPNLTKEEIEDLEAVISAILTDDQTEMDQMRNFDDWIEPLSKIQTKLNNLIIQWQD